MKKNKEKKNKNNDQIGTKSIFFKIGLFLLPIVLLLDILVLFLSYRITYNNNLNIYEKQIENAAKMAVQYCEAFDLKDDDSFREYNLDYDSICRMFGITYVFVLDPDIDNNSETYLAIGFGEGASEEAKETRYRGVKVEGTLTKQQIDAYNGNTDAVPIHEKNQFDDTLVCYLPCTKYIDMEKGEYVSYDKPILVGAEVSLDSINDAFEHQFNQVAILTISLTLLIVASFTVILHYKVSKPVRRISKRMSSFISDREEGFEKLEVKGNDEFAQMSRAFNSMAEEIDRYIDDIDALTREKHTSEAEMNIARRIQKGLLLPDHLDSDRAAIDAYMLPAREVGGDLYDYQILEDGRIFVAVADVSGKGISAALFMSRAITLLHQFMLRETSPAKILCEYNDTLIKRNPGGLFITTFLAVWDPATGELTYSNAGHNFPYILSDTLITLEGAHGVAAGLFEGEEYENASVLMKQGDILFLYTDGVNEAKNAENAFYSTQRLEKKLAEFSKTDHTDTLTDILSDLNSFTQGAAQNDDVTMLSLLIKQKRDEIVLRLRSELSQLTKIKEAIFTLDVGEDMKRTLYLAAEEMFVNICSYAYDAPGDVILKIAPTDGGAALTFTDGGKPFDPTADLLDIDEYDHEHAIGGLGRFLTFSIADDYRYEYRDGRNILYLNFNEVKSDDHHKNA